MSWLSFCNLFGHKWRYKDYTYAQKLDGKKYGFTSTRVCKRCDKKEYKFAKWTDEKFVPNKELDY